MPDTEEALRSAILVYMEDLKIKETLTTFSHTIKYVEKISKEEQQKE